MSFSTYNYLKLEWTKNKGPGGAQAHVLAQKSENEVCVHVCSKRNGKMWTNMSKEKLRELVEGGNRNLYEVISDFPHKAYLDIDAKFEEGNPPPTREQFEAWILELIPDAELAWSGSEVPGEKNSYHVVFQNYVILNQGERTNFKAFVKGRLQEKHIGFDTAVYNRNNLMKCVYQSKNVDQDPLQRVQAPIGDMDVKHHLITCFNDLSAGIKSVSDIPNFVNTMPTPLPMASGGAMPKYDILNPAAPPVDWHLGDYTTKDLSNPLDLLSLLPPLENTTLDPPQDLEKLLDLLVDEFDDYHSWAKMAWITKSLNVPFGVFDDYSRRFPLKYDLNAAVKQWDSSTISRTLSPGILHSMAQLKNQEAYIELGLSYRSSEVDTYTWMVGRFCFHNGIKLDDFYGWYRVFDDTDASRVRWEEHLWGRLADYPVVSVKQILYVLEKYYPRIMVNQELQEFDALCDISDAPFIETKQLEQEHFECDTKAVILNIGMGGGKTTQTVDYLKKRCHKWGGGEDNTDSFVWMTPNIALADNTFERMGDINHTEIYNSAKRTKDKKKLILDAKNLMICMHSLHYTEGRARKFDVVVIDEIESFLKNWVYNTTLEGQTQTACYAAFIDILTHAKKIILLDAFITKLTLDFFTSLGIDYTIVKRENDLDFNERVAVKFNKSSHMIADVIKQLKKGKKVLIFYPHLRGNQAHSSMDDLRRLLVENTKTKDANGSTVEKKCLCHNSMTDDRTKSKLAAVNIYWKECDFVISNNVITVGVNFDEQHFDSCYLFVATFNEPRDVVQFSYRARNLTSYKVNYCFLSGKMSKDDSLLDKMTEIHTPEFQQLRRNVMVEKTSPLQQTFCRFLSLAGYTIEPEAREVRQRDLDAVEQVEASGSFYDYDKIAEVEWYEVNDLEREFYSGECSMKTKLELRRYHFDRWFYPGPLMQNAKLLHEVKAKIWNNNFIELATQVRLLENGHDPTIDKLKADQGWEHHFPSEIVVSHKQVSFKFADPNAAKSIFDSGLTSKSLSLKSSHHEILKSFINHYFNYEVITTDKEKKPIIDPGFLEMYELIKSSVRTDAWYDVWSDAHVAAKEESDAFLDMVNSDCCDFLDDDGYDAPSDEPLDDGGGGAAAEVSLGSDDGGAAEAMKELSLGSDNGGAAEAMKELIKQTALQRDLMSQYYGLIDRWTDLGNQCFKAFTPEAREGVPPFELPDDAKRDLRSQLDGLIEQAKELGFELSDDESDSD